MNAKENVPARMTNMNGALPSGEFGHVQVQAKAILQVSVPSTDAYNVPTPSMQSDKFGGIQTPQSKDQYFADRSGKEASISNPVISRHTMSPMVSAILDELTETASSILAEDHAGLAVLNSQIEEACSLKPNFRHAVLPRLRLGCSGSSNSPSKSGYAGGAGNSKQSFSSTTMAQLFEKCPSAPDVRNSSGCVEPSVEVEARDVNLAVIDTTGDFAPGFARCDDNPLRGIVSYEQVTTSNHKHNAIAHLDFTPEVRKT